MKRKPVTTAPVHPLAARRAALKARQLARLPVTTHVIETRRSSHELGLYLSVEDMARYGFARAYATCIGNDIPSVADLTSTRVLSMPAPFWGQQPSFVLVAAMSRPEHTIELCHRGNRDLTTGRPRGITTAAAWRAHQTRALTADQRDDRRAAKDLAFRRALRRRRAAAAAAQTLSRDLAVAIADRYHHTIASCYTSAESEWTWSWSPAERKTWPYKGQMSKYPKIWHDPAVIADEKTIRITSVRGKVHILPMPPKKLRKLWDRRAVLPRGLFGVPVHGQPGVTACMGVVAGKWVAVGFAVAGHLVPECVARGTITLADIQTETSTEAQRIMIERMGYDRYLAAAGAGPAQEDEFGRLYTLPGGAKLARLLNSTPNPDGTINEYFLPVPATVRTAHEAVAWSFGCQVAEYAPAAQS